MHQQQCDLSSLSWFWCVPLMCLQVFYNNSDDNSFLEYDSQEVTSAYSALMHSCG
jgi:hypothetical protein